MEDTEKREEEKREEEEREEREEQEEKEENKRQAERKENYIALYKEIQRRERVYQMKLISDRVRRKYSSLWLRRQSIRERAKVHPPNISDRVSAQKDLFLIAPVKSSTPENKEDAIERNK